MKYAKLVILLLSCQHAFCQTKLSINVVSNETKQPIEGVSISYNKSNEGTFTNVDGKAILNLINVDSIILTHIAYDTLYLSTQEIASGDTVLARLNVRPIQIAEISIPPYDLHKSLKYVLDNFDKLYVNTPHEKIGNFKETARINGVLKRLVLTKMSWWSNGYMLNARKQPRLKLFDVEYNKEVPFNIFNDVPEQNLSNSAYADIKSVLLMLYLKSFLTQVITYTPSLRSADIYADDHITKVEFESDWNTVRDQTTRSTGYFVFDKKSKAIIEFLNSIEDKTGSREVELKSAKISFGSENKRTITKHVFYKNNDHRYSLKNFSLSTENEITYKNKVFNTDINMSFFLLKETPKKKFNSHGIDLGIALHKNIPEKAEIADQTNSIILSSDEKKFIEQSRGQDL